MKTLTIDLDDEINAFVHEDAPRLRVSTSRYIGALLQLCMKEARRGRLSVRDEIYNQGWLGLREHLRDTINQAAERMPEPAPATTDGRGPTSGWLRCRLDRGMFGDEVAVTYPAEGRPQQISVFVPKSCVRCKGDHTGVVRVKVFERGGARYAVLPTPLTDVVRVEASDLAERESGDPVPWNQVGL